VSAPPTLVLRDDDERTIVDPRSPEDPQASMPGGSDTNQRSDRLETALRRRWRALLGAMLLGALLLSFVVTASYQRRRYDRVLDAIRALQRSYHGSPGPDAGPMLPAMQRPSDSVLDRQSAPPDVSAASRGELELDAASFLIANDFANAIDRYRALSGRFPDEQVFSSLVAILGSRLGCPAGTDVPGSGCD
jgi:hypothetical protein